MAKESGDQKRKKKFLAGGVGTALLGYALRKRLQAPVSNKAAERFKSQLNLQGQSPI